MIENFKTRFSEGLEETLNIGKIISEGDLTNEETLRLERMKQAWNFYEGYHWEGIDDLDSPQTTLNYCRTFVNKFVAFEFGKGFSIKAPSYLDNKPITNNDKKIDQNKDLNNDGVITDEENNSPDTLVEKTTQEYLDEVWDNNNREERCVEIGQTKSITGDAWVQVKYEEPEDMYDPFGEYTDKGRIRLIVIPSQFVFPRFNQHDKDRLESMLIMYPIQVEHETGILLRRTALKTVMYKEYWTKDKITVYEDKEIIDTMDNPYGIIPFVQIKNFLIAGRTYGQGDLDDVIPLNMELNFKNSDCSEILDYHAAPVTMVFGAQIGSLEKGANKVWGGLPKDAKVNNLELQGDLGASTNYINSIKTAMCEIGSVPESVLGGANAISNTSGVALQYMNLPLIERTRIKRLGTSKGLQMVNKMILFISLEEGLIKRPEGVSMRDFLANEVILPDTLPKDELMELQKIQQEMNMGLECRHGAMERTGKSDIEDKLNEIDSERAEHPELFGGTPKVNNINSGMTNGQTAIEQVRVETTGQNGGGGV